jgi:energy-converting hydrogenase Eha subunit E
MNWLVNNMKWIMLVSGILTSTMIYAAIMPQAALNSTFGTSLEGPLAEIVVRNWGALIALIGVSLIYGAFNTLFRPLILSFAGVSKLVFIGLVLTYGQAFLSHQAGVAIGIDSIMLVLYCLYLIGVRNTRATNGV